MQLIINIPDTVVTQISKRGDVTSQVENLVMEYYAQITAVEAKLSEQVLAKAAKPPKPLPKKPPTKPSADVKVMSPLGVINKDGSSSDDGDTLLTYAEVCDLCFKALALALHKNMPLNARSAIDFYMRSHPKVFKGNVWESFSSNSRRTLGWAFQNLCRERDLK